MANGPKWSAMTAPKGAMISPQNDLRHNITDPNKGGSPLGRFAGTGRGSNPGSRAGVSRTQKIPPAQRGGFGHQGRDVVAVKAGMSGARGSSGNPATRGGFSGQARGGAFQPEKRVPNHGGSPQVRERHSSNFPLRGGFGAQGQGKQDKIVPGQVPNYGMSDPSPDAGNTSGRSYRLIAGRFKRAAMGAKASQGSTGKYGSPPISTNT